jgi:large subunit ribosomal protein L13
MQTLFPKNEYHCPKWFVIDASDQTLGRLASEISNLLRGKNIAFYTPGINQGNFVVILNAAKIKITGNKELQKKYYKNNQRPGSLKTETFKQLKTRIPSRIIEQAVWGMLPKRSLGRQYFRQLFVYNGNKIIYKKNKEGNTLKIPLELMSLNNWIKKDI